MFKAVLNVPSAEPKDIRWFYDRYAAMLLGYINGIVEDHQKSEDHLVAILSAFARDFVPQEKNQLNTWLALRQYAQNRLQFNSIEPGLKRRAHTNHEQLNQLDDKQKEIFCAVYYHGKPVSYLAATLGLDEHEIRNQLKLSIDKMRRASGN